MSKQMKIGLVVAALFAAAIVFGMATYIEHVKDDAATKAKIEIEQAKVDAAEKTIAQIKQLTTAQVDALEKMKGEIKTPQQAERVIHEYAPLTTAQVLPDAPSSAKVSTLTLDDATKLSDFSLSCRQCDIERDGLVKEAEQKALQMESLKRERDLAITNAKGGGFFKRLKRNSKWLVIGVAVGAAATAAAHH